MQRENRKLAAVLAADVVDYSRLIGQDELATVSELRRLRRDIIDVEIRNSGGCIANTAGDSMLVEFPSVADATSCAIAIQNQMQCRNESVVQDLRICFRIGINVGDVIEIEGDLFGDVVNVSARLEGMCEPGSVMLSAAAHQYLNGSLRDAFVSVGALQLKNIAEPIRAFSWSAAYPMAAPKRVKRQSEADNASIAVLPLASMSDDKQHEYLADGLTEDITTLLARIPTFFVIARNSAFVYKGMNPDIRDVGRDLGVRYVVEGSLRPIGRNFRVTVQLIDAETGQHIWAKRFDHPADTIFELQDHITTAIVSHLQPELTKVEFDRIERRSPANFDAWSYYLKAAGLLAVKGWRRETFTEAAELYRRAISLDGDLAPAHAGLAILLSIGHLVGFVSQPDEALAAAEKAIELTDNDSEVLGYAGCALADIGHVERGIEVLEQAIALNPSNAQAIVALGGAEFISGNPARAVELFDRGLGISPLDSRQAVWRGVYALALSRCGRLEQALEEANRACRQDGKLQNPRVILAALLAYAGRNEEALTALSEARRIQPELTYREIKGLVGTKSANILADLDPAI